MTKQKDTNTLSFPHSHRYSGFCIKEGGRGGGGDPAKRVARPIDGNPDDQTFKAFEVIQRHSRDEVKPYDIEARFTKMRERYARETQRFMYSHYEACLLEIQKRCATDDQVLRTNDLLNSWLAKTELGFSAQKENVYAEIVKGCTLCIINNTLPEAKSRVAVAKATEGKRLASPSDAHRSFAKPDATGILALAHLDAKHLVPKGINATAPAPQNELEKLMYGASQGPEAAEKKTRSR